MLWQLLAFAVAVAVTAAPDLLGLQGPVADAFHILGPIAAAVAAMAASAVLRGVRRLHMLLGPAIAIAPFILGGPPGAILLGVVAGAILTALAVPGAARPGQYGGGWPAVLDPGKGTDR